MLSLDQAGSHCMGAPGVRHIIQKRRRKKMDLNGPRPPIDPMAGYTIEQLPQNQQGSKRKSRYLISYCVQKPREELVIKEFIGDYGPYYFWGHASKIQQLPIIHKMRFLNQYQQPHYSFKASCPQFFNDR